MDADTLLKNFEVLAEAPGGVDRLRDLILDLAINGLISNSDTSSWRVTTLGDEVQIIRGITFPSSAKGRSPGRGLLPCLRTANIQNEVDWEDLLYVSEDFVRNDDQYVQLNDLLISMANSRELVGKVALVRRNDISCTLGGFIAAIRCGAGIDPKYLMTILRVPSAREKLIDSSTQTTNIANISLGRLRPFVLSLPPLSEQQVIVAKVDELMALCDQLEQLQRSRDSLRVAARKSVIDAIPSATTPDELEVARKRINSNWEVMADTPESIDSLRSLILESAVTGKLSQDGDSWKIRTLGEVTKIRTGKLDANASSPDGEYPFFTCAKSPLRISSFSYNTECVLLAGNGNFDVNYYSGKFDAYQRTYIIEAKSADELFVPYLFRFMQRHSKKLLAQAIGGVIKYIKIGFLTNASILLPSFSEQQRVSGQVDVLMEICDQLEAQLKVRNELAEKFARSVVSAA